MRLSPLKDPITPEVGESLRSVVARSLAAGGVPRTWTITRHLGIPHAGQTDFAENLYLDLPELARVIRAPLAELEARRRPPVGAGRRSFHGLVVMNAFETRLRRFAPAALATGGFCRDVWELKAIPFCHDTFQILIHTCRCGKRQTWTRPNGVALCDDCGRELRLTPAEEVPAYMRDVIALPALLASPVEEDRAKAAAILPAALRTLDRSIVFDVLVRLRAALWDGDGVMEQDLSSMHAASVAMAAWPDGLRGLGPGAGLGRAPWHEIRRQYTDLADRPHAPSRIDAPAAAAAEARGSRRLPVAAVPGLTRRAASTSVAPPLARMPAPAPIREERRGMLGLDAAAVAAGVAPSTLRRGYDGRLVRGTERSHGGRTVLAFHRGDAVEFGAAYLAGSPLDAVGTELGMHPASVAQLVAAKLLPAHAPSLPGEGPKVAATDLAAFLAALGDASRSAVDRPLRLYRAIFAVAGRPKPWGAIVAAMLAGDLPFSIGAGRFGREDRRCRFAGTPFYMAEVPAASLPLIAAMPDTVGPDWLASHGSLTKLEACEILNLTPNTRALDALPKTEGRFWRFDQVNVVRLAERGIGVGELAFRCRWRPPGAHKILRRFGVATVGDGLWCRATIESMLASGRF